MSHAGHSVDAESRVPEEDEALGDTVGHRTHVVNSGHVARWLGEGSPVDDEDVVTVITGQVR